MKKLNKLILNKIGQNDVLRKREMKNIIGGYGGGSFSCIHEYSGGIRESCCCWSLEAAVEYCRIYASMDYACRCYQCCIAN